MTLYFQSVLAEHLYLAALVGDAARLAKMLEKNHFPEDVRDLAHDIADAGGHTEAAAVIKPVLH